MVNRPRIFISYKTGVNDGLSFMAHSVRKALASRGYDVWMDETNLKAGEDWNTQIYSEIPARDILLLLLAGEAANSDWVRREVDVAKGAKVSILPVLIRGDLEKQEVLDKFDIPRLQFVDLRSGTDEEYEKLVAAIELLKDDTRKRQEEWLSKRTDITRIKLTPAKAQPDYAVYQLQIDQSAHPHKLRLAAGNVLEMHNIDVLVNTENAYLQMARLFESETISALVRYAGSYVDAAGRLVEDTIQDELNLKLVEKGFPRPVGTGTVIATSAGHAEGELRKDNEFRYVFHTVSVDIVGDGVKKELRPIFDDSSLKRCTRKTLEMIMEVDQAKGVVSPKGTPQRREQEALAKLDKYEPIRSIVLPLFTAGHGGRPAQEVLPPIIQGVKEFIIDQRDNKALAVEEFYLCIYYEEQLKLAEEKLKEAGFVKI